MIIKSLLTEDNPFNTTEEITGWIEQRNREVGKLRSKRFLFHQMKMWHSEPDGSHP